MLTYDRHAWFNHIFARSGSVLHIVLPRMLGLFAISIVTLLAHRAGHVHDIPPMVHAVLGTVLGLILAFRTNTAYDRFWEGRRCWGLITNRTRDLARQCHALLPNEGDHHQVAKFLAGFAQATKRHLWQENDVPELAEFFSPSEIAVLNEAPGPSQRCLLGLSDLLIRAKKMGQITDVELSMMDRNITELQDQLGACQRIQRTPIPLAYVIFLRRFIVVYLVTLPLALIDQAGWWTPFVMLIVSYAMLGIEELGVQIEDPFEQSPSDINLDRLARNVQRDVVAIMGGHEPVPASRMPPSA